jgi:acyl-CoA synthetase (NDP forming)
VNLQFIKKRAKVYRPKMRAAQFLPNSQLRLSVLLLAILVVGSAIAFGFVVLHYDGDVLCRIGTAEVPVKHAEVILMEEDCLYFPGI